MPVRLPFLTLVAVVADRLAALAHPATGEPSPVLRGATPAEWARHGGIGCEPHPTLLLSLRHGEKLPPIDPGEYTAEHLAHRALQRLRARAVVEAAGPDRYRPAPRRG